MMMYRLMDRKINYFILFLFYLWVMEVEAEAVYGLASSAVSALPSFHPFQLR